MTVKGLIEKLSRIENPETTQVYFSENPKEGVFLVREIAYAPSHNWVMILPRKFSNLEDNKL